MQYNKKTGLLFVISTLLLVFSFSAMEVEAVDDAYYDGQVEDERVDENLDLPDIYENTIIYNGTVNPELNFGFHLPGSDDPESPYVNEAGQFSLSLAMEELQAGEEITLRFGEDGREPNDRTLEVQPAVDGMEIVESNADTSSVQNSVLEATEFDWHDSGSAVNLDIETVGDLDGAPFYTVNDNPITEENRLEHIQENQFRAHLSERSIVIGDVVTVYIVASGVTTPLEVEVPDTLESLAAEGTDTEEEPGETEDSDEVSDPEDEDEAVDEDEDEEDQEDDESEEIEPPEVEDAEEEADDGISIVWIIVGVLIALAIIGGIIYGVKRKNNNTKEDELS